LIKINIEKIHNRIKLQNQRYLLENLYLINKRIVIEKLKLCFFSFTAWLKSEYGNNYLLIICILEYQILYWFFSFGIRVDSFLSLLGYEHNEYSKKTFKYLMFDIIRIKHYQTLMNKLFLRICKMSLSWFH